MITFIYLLIAIVVVVYIVNLHFSNVQLKKQIKSLEHNHNECPHITYIKGIKHGKKIG